MKNLENLKLKNMFLQPSLTSKSSKPNIASLKINQNQTYYAPQNYTQRTANSPKEKLQNFFGTHQNSFRNLNVTQDIKVQKTEQYSPKGGFNQQKGNVFGYQKQVAQQDKRVVNDKLQLLLKKMIKETDQKLQSRETPRSTYSRNTSRSNIYSTNQKMANFNQKNQAKQSKKQSTSRSHSNKSNYREKSKGNTKNITSRQFQKITNLNKMINTQQSDLLQVLKRKSSAGNLQTGKYFDEKSNFQQKNNAHTNSTQKLFSILTQQQQNAKHSNTNSKKLLTQEQKKNKQQQCSTTDKKKSLERNVKEQQNTIIKNLFNQIQSKKPTQQNEQNILIDLPYSDTAQQNIQMQKQLKEMQTQKDFEEGKQQFYNQAEKSNLLHNLTKQIQKQKEEQFKQEAEQQKASSSMSKLLKDNCKDSTETGEFVQQAQQSQENNLKKAGFINSLSDIKPQKTQETNQQKQQIQQQEKQNKNIAQQINEKKQNNSQPASVVIDIKKLLKIEKLLDTIYFHFETDEKITDLTKQYLNEITVSNLENLDQLSVIQSSQTDQETSKKIFKNMVIYERFSIILALCFSFQKELLKINKENIKMILQYSYQNILLVFEILLENLEFPSQEDKIYNSLKETLMQKKSRNTLKHDKTQLIQRNCTIIKNKINQLLKHDRSNMFQLAKDLLLNIDNISIEEAMSLLMNQFSLLIKEIENYIENGEKQQSDPQQWVKPEQQNMQQNNLEEEKTTTQTQAINDDDQEIIEFAKPPFLPPLSVENKEKYTLVLDLDETLVHFQELEENYGQFLVRPHAEKFIEEMAKFYEVVIFTAALPDYANWILDLIDTQKSISYRLYRNHCTYLEDAYYKDITKIGREIEKIIIIDNLAENFQLSPENGIFISTWVGDENDQALLDLIPILKQIVTKKIPDVRNALKNFRNKLLNNIKEGIENPHQNLELD